jgi:hypothetical protein
LAYGIANVTPYRRAHDPTFFRPDSRADVETDAEPDSIPDACTYG